MDTYIWILLGSLALVILSIPCAIIGLFLYDRRTVRNVLLKGDMWPLRRGSWRTYWWLNRCSVLLFDTPGKATGNYVQVAMNLIRASQIMHERGIAQKDASWMEWPALRNAVEKAVETCSIQDAVRLYDLLSQAEKLEAWGRKISHSYIEKLIKYEDSKPLWIATPEEWTETLRLAPHLQKTDRDRWTMLRWHLEHCGKNDLLAEYKRVTPPEKRKTA